MKYPKNFIKNALACGVGLTLPVAAQAALEEVVVTAQKRSESLQDVPIAVSAYTGDSMKTLGVTDASDLVNITPGLASTAQAGPNRNYFIRGVGTTDFHLTAASAVGQYYDGITLTSGFHARAALFDMDRVEVLKGPQNTLFGLNTTGGAVNYITKKPEIGAGTSGSFSLTLESDSLVNTETAIGFDITENLAARVAVQTNQHDGPFKSETNGVEYGSDDTQAYRAAFLWEPSDVASILFNLHGMENEGNGSPVRALGTRSADGLNEACGQFDTGVLDFEDNTNCLSRNGGMNGDPAADPSTGNWDTLSISFGQDDVKTKGYYLKFDYELEWATFNFITAWDNLDMRVSNDIDGGPTTLLHVNQSDDRDTYQHELRLVSPSDSAFRWIAGVYYLDEEAESYTGLQSPGIGGGVRIPNVQLDHSKENLGVYFQGEYDFSDNLTLTTGIRWSDEELVGDYLPSSPNGADFLGKPVYTDDIDALVREQFAGMEGFDSNGYEIARQVQQVLPNEDVGYTVKLDWKATDESLVYMSFSKGFKGSALDIRAAYALVPVANILAGLEDARLDPESLETWELGYKSSFWENRIQFDASLFHYTYNDLQQFVTAGGVPTLENAPESEIIGFDGNLKFANDSGFYLDLGLSILDSEVTEAGDSNFVVGAELASTPGWSASAIASQEYELDNGNLLTISANMSHTDDQVKRTLVNGNSQIEDTLTVEAYTLLNANLTYRFGGDQQYGVSLFGSNLTDEHYCGMVEANEGNNILIATADNPAFMGTRALNYNVFCRVDRGSTRTFGASFTVDF